MTGSKATHIVLRPARGVSASTLGGSLAGTWIDVRDTPPASFALGGLVAVATDRFEAREDGTTARVYEVRPAGPRESPIPPAASAAPEGG